MARMDEQSEVSSALAGRPAGGSADKILRVLNAVAAPGGPHRLVDLSRRTGVSKSSAHRLAVLLTAEGYLVTNGGGMYDVGPELRALAAQVVGDGRAGVHKILVDLQELVSGQTVHLAVRSGDHAIYIDKVDGDRPYQMASRVGMRLLLHSTAIGKAILSRLPTDEVDQISTHSGLPTRTPNTVRTRAELHRELDLVRARGCAYDDEENEATIRCVAVPVSSADRNLLGGLSVSTVTFVTSREELEAFVEPLLAFAPRVGKALA